MERFVQKIDQNALYVAEMVRQELYEKYGEEAYTQGFKVYTTVNIENQRVATEALRKVLRNFDRGSSYRGAENYLDLSKSDNVEETVGQYLSSVYTVDKNWFQPLSWRLPERALKSSCQVAVKLH